MLQGAREIGVGGAKRRIQVQALTVRRERALKPAREEQGIAHNGVGEQIQGIELVRALGLSDGFLVPSHPGKKQRITITTESISRIELEGAQTLAFGGRPIPVEETMNPAERSMELGQGLIEAESTLGRPTPEGVAFPGREDVVVREHDLAVSGS